MRSITTRDAERIAKAFKSKIINYVHHGKVVFGLELPVERTEQDMVEAGADIVDILGITTGRSFIWNMERNGNQIFFPEWQVS